MSKPEQQYKCLDCGREGFIKPGPHNCNGTLRKTDYHFEPVGSAASPARTVTLASAFSLQPSALPNKDTDLNKLAADCKKLQVSIKAKTVDLIYDIVGFGLRLLKAKDVHQSDHLTRFGAKKNDGAETVSGPDGGKADSAPEGYHKWLKDHFPDLNERTARNYANAALNAGLTAGSPLTVIKDIRKEQMLDGKQLTDLYRPPRQLTNGEPVAQSEEEQPNLVRDAIRALGEDCDNIVNLRDQLTAKQYEAVIDRLSDALKLLTDCEWNMVGSNVTLAASESGVQRHAAAARAGQKSARAL